MTLHGQQYGFADLTISFKVAETIGSFAMPPCLDTGRSPANTTPPEDRTMRIARVAELDLNDGIAVFTGDAPNGYRLLGRHNPDGHAFTPAFEAFAATHRSNPAASENETEGQP